MADILLGFWAELRAVQEERVLDSGLGLDGREGVCLRLELDGGFWGGGGDRVKGRIESGI